MSDTIWRDEPPTEPGFYWVRGIKYEWTAELTDNGAWSCHTTGVQFGPRVPDPETCARIERGGAMDAEQMLEEFVDMVNTQQRMITHPEYHSQAKKVKALRSQLLPILRAGLALQRLEKWLPEGHEFNIGRAYGVYGAKVWKMIGEHRVSGTGQTLLEAINAALDAAEGKQ